MRKKEDETTIRDTIQTQHEKGDVKKDPDSGHDLERHESNIVHLKQVKPEVSPSSSNPQEDEVDFELDEL